MPKGGDMAQERLSEAQFPPAGPTGGPGTVEPFSESQSGGDVQPVLHGVCTKPAWPQAALLTRDAKIKELIPKATPWEAVRRGQSRRNSRLQESLRGTKGEREEREKDTCI